MPVEEDVLRIGRQLEKLVSQGKADSENAMEMLKHLRDIPISLEILQKTRIGMSVNVLRKASSKDDIQSLAKTLIKSWKKLLDGQDKNKNAKSSSQESNDQQSNLSRIPSFDSSNSSSQFSQGSVNGDQKSSQTPSKPSPKVNNTKRSSVSFPPMKGDVAVRERCISMLANSLKCDELPDADVDGKAAEIENAVFQEFKSDTGTKYKNRIKSRVMNLRDKNNPDLKVKVLEGTIAAERFAIMKPEELASEQKKQERRAITEQAIKDHQLAVSGGTGTDQFKCSRCGKRNCTYNQVQTRSADEPMTTFVLCNECGNRWKGTRWTQIAKMKAQKQDVSSRVCSACSASSNRKHFSKPFGGMDFGVN